MLTQFTQDDASPLLNSLTLPLAGRVWGDIVSGIATDMSPSSEEERERIEARKAFGQYMLCVSTSCPKTVFGSDGMRSSFVPLLAAMYERIQAWDPSTQKVYLSFLHSITVCDGDIFDETVTKWLASNCLLIVLRIVTAPQFDELNAETLQVFLQLRHLNFTV